MFFEEYKNDHAEAAEKFKDLANQIKKVRENLNYEFDTQKREEAQNYLNRLEAQRNYAPYYWMTQRVNDASTKSVHLDSFINAIADSPNG